MIDEYDIESPPTVAQVDHAPSGSTNVLPPGDRTEATAESWMVDEIVECSCCAVYDAARFGVGCVGEGRGWLPEGEGAGEGLETAVADEPAERREEQSVAEAVRPLLLLSGELVRGAKGDGNG